MMKIINILLLAAIAFGFFSCDIKDPVEGIEVRLNTITRETLVTGYIYDASTGNSIDQNIKITFMGSNAEYIVDETNDATKEFSLKSGFFNFAIKDGITINQNNPFKVVVVIKSQGYLDAEYPVVLNTKGTQGLTFFLAKKEDFADEITVSEAQTGNAGDDGTVKDTVTATTENGTEITIPKGTELKDSDGSPLEDELTTTITTVVYNDNTSGIEPPSSGTEGNQAMAPMMNINIEIKDSQGNVATNLSQPIYAEIPLEQYLSNPVTGGLMQPGDSIPVWYLTEHGTYARSYPSAYVSSDNLALHKSSSVKSGLTLHAFISFINTYLGFTAPISEPKFIVSNPRPGYSLQVFFSSNGVFAPIAYSGQVNSNELSITPDNYPDLSYTVLFKHGANPVNGEGGWTYASINWSTANSGSQVPVTFNYPQESIQASVKITGVCSSRDPIVRTYPTITFNYRKKGTSTWMQGSLSNGSGVIAGLEANTTYEATTTYRDKEASVDIHVNSATDFTIGAGENQGSLLRSEVKGTSTENGITYVNLEIDIDLKDDCD